MIASEKSFSSQALESELLAAWFQQSIRLEWLLDPSGKVIELNPACIQLTKVERPNWVGRKLWNCVWWVERPEANHQLQSLCAHVLSGMPGIANFTSLEKEPQLRTFRWTVSPLRNPAGELIALNVSGEEVSERVELEQRWVDADRRRQFLDQLEATVQSLTDADAILACVAKQLAHHLNADRCAYAEVENESLFVITGDYSDQLPSIVGIWPVASFGVECQRAMLANEPFVLNDVDHDARVSADDFAAYRTTRIQSAICVPLHKDGRFSAAMAVHQATPRQWTASEVELVTTVVARCWESLERARAAQSEVRSQVMAESDRRSLEEVFKLAPSFMAVLRGPNHVFERVNDRYREISGDRELIGLSVAQAFPELTDQGIYEILDSVYQSGEPYAASDIKVALKEPGTEQLQIHHLDFVYQPLRDLRGEVTGILVQGIDLTERSRAKQALMQLTAQSDAFRRLYETVLSNTPDLVYVFDLDHRFTYANAALLNMWGKTWDEAIGRNCLELGYEPWHAALHDREIEEVRRTKRSIRGEVPFTGVTGRRIYDYIFAPVMGADGEVEAIAGTTRDVTERKSMEQALWDADKRKDEFLAMLAHELRNPLAPIRSGIDVLRMSGVDSEILDVMQRQVDHLIRLVDDLLDVARIIRGKVELKPEVVELSGVIRRAIETIRPMVDHAHQSFEAVLPENAIWLRADPIRLAQVFSNLLHNASKYTDRQGHLQLSVVEPEPGEVRVVIDDNGIGISNEVLPHVFELFTQDDRNIDRSQGGLGIGLTVVRSLVEMHGGRVTAYSAGLGQGSEFCVTLPVVDAPLLLQPIKEYQPLPASLDILVVDDNESATFMLSRLLAKLGDHRVQIVHDGTAALTTAQLHRFDLILLDIGLPKVDGYEVAKAVRQMPGGKSVRIVALTGYGTDADRRKSFAAGFDEHYVKPPGIADLRRILSNFSGPMYDLDGE